jgi:hypothetical protein
VHVAEGSDQAVVPAKGPNKDGKSSAEGLEGRAWAKETRVGCASSVLSGRVTVFLRPASERSGGSSVSVFAIIRGKSRMSQRSRTDLCGGRWATGVPTATGSSRSTFGGCPGSSRREHFSAVLFQVFHSFLSPKSELPANPRKPLDCYLSNIFPCALWTDRESLWYKSSHSHRIQ